MDISITLPDEVAEQMRARWRDLSRRALEALVSDGYRAGLVTSAQVQKILGLDSRWAVEDFLHQAGAPLHYGIQEFQEDMDALQALPES